MALERDPLAGVVLRTLRLDLAQYRELAAFAQFGSDLDKATQAQLNRGARLVEVLKQPQYQPLPVEKQVAIVYAGTQGLLDEDPVPQIRAYEEQFHRFMETRFGNVLASVRDKKTLDDEMRSALTAAVKEFNATFSAARA